MGEMARYLVVANPAGESPLLRTEVARVVAGDPEADFVVLVPIGPIPPGTAAAGRMDWPAALARRRARRARDRLESIGAHVIRRRVAAEEPLGAIEEELVKESFRTVIISTVPAAGPQRSLARLAYEVACLHPSLDVREVVGPRVLYRDEPDVPSPAAAAPPDMSAG